MESFFIAKGFRMVIQNCPKKENLLIEKKSSCIALNVSDN